jgi:hypothetical protein
MRSMQKRPGTWEPSQHLLRDVGRPRKPVAGLSGYVRTAGQRSGKQKLIQ